MLPLSLADELTGLASKETPAPTLVHLLGEMIAAVNNAPQICAAHFSDPLTSARHCTIPCRPTDSCLSWKHLSVVT